MDADDELQEDYFEILVRDIEQENADIVLCNYYEVYITEKKFIRLPWENVALDCVKIKNDLIPCMIAGSKKQESIRGVVWRTFVRKSFYEKNKIQFDEEVEIAEDLLFLIELYNKATCIYIESAALYLYYKNYNSSMNRYRNDSLNRSVLFHSKLEALLIKENLYTDNIERFQASKAFMYTSEISSLSHINDMKYARLKMKELRELLMEDEILMKTLDISVGRKISLLLLEKKCYALLLLIYKYKEIYRLKRFMH